MNAITPHEKLFAAIMRSGVAGAIRPIQEPNKHYLLTLPSRRRSQIVTRYNAAVQERELDRAAVNAWCQENPNVIPVLSKLKNEFETLYEQGKEIPLLPNYPEDRMEPDDVEEDWGDDELVG